MAEELLTQQQTRTPGIWVPRLDDLETAATQPVLAGEASAWARTIEKRLAVMAPVLTQVVERDHKAFRAMLEADMTLAPRVEPLKARDQELISQLVGLSEGTRALVGTVEPTSSAEPTRAAEELRHELLEWIVACRSHRSEVMTWLTEAYYRDRGAGD